MPFLQNRLKPAAVADQNNIQKWISDLDNDGFLIRQAAAKELENVGRQVQPPLQKAMVNNVSLETRRRLEHVLKNVMKTLNDVPGPETVRTIRANLALERIGSPEAQAVLETLAKGAPGARETEEAKASLERLKQRVVKVP